MDDETIKKNRYISIAAAGDAAREVLDQHWPGWEHGEEVEPSTVVWQLREMFAELTYTETPDAVKQMLTDWLLEHGENLLEVLDAVATTCRLAEVADYRGLGVRRLQVSMQRFGNAEAAFPFR